MKSVTLDSLLNFALVFSSMLAWGAVRTDGAIIMTAEEIDTYVVIKASGSLNLAGMAYQGPINIGSPPLPPYIEPRNARLIFAHLGDQLDLYQGAVGPISFGPGESRRTSGSGTIRFGFYGVNGSVFVPRNYRSGDSISTSSSYNSASFASLGMTPGKYTWTLPSDTITLRFGVPEPSSAFLLVVGLTTIGYRRRIPGRLAGRSRCGKKSNPQQHTAP